MSDSTLNRLKKEMGYEGCRNCRHQIAPLRTCKWAESGGDGAFHLLCPRWEKKKQWRGVEE
jgi:hypothetical protein